MATTAFEDRRHSRLKDHQACGLIEDRASPLRCAALKVLASSRQRRRSSRERSSRSLSCPKAAVGSIHLDFAFG